MDNRGRSPGWSCRSFRGPDFAEVWWGDFETMLVWGVMDNRISEMVGVSGLERLDDGSFVHVYAFPLPDQVEIPLGAIILLHLILLVLQDHVVVLSPYLPILADRSCVEILCKLDALDGVQRHVFGIDSLQLLLHATPFPARLDDKDVDGDAILSQRLPDVSVQVPEQLGR